MCDDSSSVPPPCSTHVLVLPAVYTRRAQKYNTRSTPDRSTTMLYDYVFFFFFQAEDGIRDDLVTGVQTCALPIYADVLRFHCEGILAPKCSRRASFQDRSGANPLSVQAKFCSPENTGRWAGSLSSPCFKGFMIDSGNLWIRRISWASSTREQKP